MRGSRPEHEGGSGLFTFFPTWNFPNSHLPREESASCERENSLIFGPKFHRAKSSLGFGFPAFAENFINASCSYNFTTTRMNDSIFRFWLKRAHSIRERARRWFIHGKSSSHGDTEASTLKPCRQMFVSACDACIALPWAISRFNLNIEKRREERAGARKFSTPKGSLVWQRFPQFKLLTGYGGWALIKISLMSVFGRGPNVRSLISKFTPIMKKEATLMGKKISNFAYNLAFLSCQEKFLPRRRRFVWKFHR